MTVELLKASYLKSILGKWYVNYRNLLYETFVTFTSQIVIHASSEAAETLTDACASIRSMTKDIFSPAVGENVQIGQHTNSFSISLAEELLATIKMSKVCCYQKFHYMT